MSKKIWSLIVVTIVSLVLFVGCTAPAEVVETEIPATLVPATAVPSTEVPPTDVPTVDTSSKADKIVALKITGLVGQEMSWSDEEIKAMTAMDVEATNSKGETEDYTGVLIADLLALAGPDAAAKTVVFVADDGYTAEAPLADVLACTNCILSFRSKGGFSSVMPTFQKNLNVKGVVELQIK
jgi:DMSO/TMAO reductase YedYZ molybdopterin-dependent catalytic subunit